MQETLTHKIVDPSQAQTLLIPGLKDPICLTLPPDIQALRDKALELHIGPTPGTGTGHNPGLPDLRLADARAWARHTEDEDWLIWRARRCAERLRLIQVDLEAGEWIVGKPFFRSPNEEEARELEANQEILASIPAYPGGDCGHFHPDYEKLFAVGIRGILGEIHRRRNAPETSKEQQVFYDACRIAMEGLSIFIRRTGDACREKASTDADHSDHWTELAGICDRIADASPTTFHEAFQLMFLTLIALWIGEDHGLTCPGRIDQTLHRFYSADIQAGRITPQRVFEMICCLYIHLNRILWPGSAVAVMVGGRDRHGNNVTNDLTYLALAARQATQLVYPTVGVAWHPDTPPELAEFAMRMLATGVGDPAFFNDDLIAAGLADHGVRPEDRHNYMNSTCVEIKICGASNMWVTAPYFNCPQGLLEVMEAVRTGSAAEPASFAELSQRVRDNLGTRIRQAAERLDATWKQRSKTGCFPLASCLVSDCLEKGLDYDRGGARYNWVENSFVGLANLVDSMLAVKTLVFDRNELTLQELADILKADFAEHEALRQCIVNTVPQYGNDNAEADEMAREWATFLMDSTESNTVGLHRYVPGFFCWIQHERLGSQTGATPDGRLAGLPFADGAGAAQGRETCGPTASVLSTTKWNHARVIGGLVHNIKFSRSLLKAKQARDAAWKVVETYLRRGGFEIQVNVVGKEVLLDAQKHPEHYQDLLVRVAGYSDYFIHLNQNMQNEVIARTEHEL